MSAVHKSITGPVDCFVVSHFTNKTTLTHTVRFVLETGNLWVNDPNDVIDIALDAQTPDANYSTMKILQGRGIRILKNSTNIIHFGGDNNGATDKLINSYTGITYEDYSVYDVYVYVDNTQVAFEISDHFTGEVLQGGSSSVPTVAWQNAYNASGLLVYTKIDNSSNIGIRNLEYVN